MTAVVLAVLAAAAALTGWLTHPGGSKPPRTPRPHAVSSAPSATPIPRSRQAGSGPPHSHDPVAFAKAATRRLWSYDTRHVSRTEHMAVLKRWMTSEKKYRDWPSVDGEVPAGSLWSRLRDNGQRATATIKEGHFPAAFKAALAQDSGALAQGYLYAVTVTGTQALSWEHGGSGAEPRSATLAVQCRPHRDCALVGVLPQVSP